jgi:hypothetical protein
MIKQHDIYPALLSNIVLPKDDKKVVVEYVRIRAARAAKPNEPAPPMILSLPKSIANKMNLSIGDDVRMITDGEKIVIQQPEMPKI